MLRMFDPFPFLPNPTRGWLPGDEPFGLYNGGPVISGLMFVLFIAVAVRFWWLIRQRHLSPGE